MIRGRSPLIGHAWPLETSINKEALNPPTPPNTAMRGRTNAPPLALRLFRASILALAAFLLSIMKISMGDSRSFATTVESELPLLTSPAAEASIRPSGEFLVQHFLYPKRIFAFLVRPNIVRIQVRQWKMKELVFIGPPNLALSKLLAVSR